MDTFKRGDVVKLKSGGPAMTVHTVDSDGSVFCDGPKQESGSFMGEMLVKYDPAKRGPMVV